MRTKERLENNLERVMWIGNTNKQILERSMAAFIIFSVG